MLRRVTFSLESIFFWKVSIRLAYFLAISFCSLGKLAKSQSFAAEPQKLCTAVGSLPSWGAVGKSREKSIFRKLQAFAENPHPWSGRTTATLWPDALAVSDGEAELQLVFIPIWSELWAMHDAMQQPCGDRPLVEGNCLSPGGKRAPWSSSRAAPLIHRILGKRLSAAAAVQHVLFNFVATILINLCCILDFDTLIFRCLRGAGGPPTRHDQSLATGLKFIRCDSHSTDLQQE